MTVTAKRMSRVGLQAKGGIEMNREKPIQGEGMGVSIYNQMLSHMNGGHMGIAVQAGRPVPKTTERGERTMRPVEPRGVGPDRGRASEPSSERAGIAKTLAVSSNRGYAAKKTHS